MRICQIADLHISENRAEEFESIVDDLIESINKHHVDHVIFCGDMFVHRGRLSPQQVLLARKLFSGISQNSKIISIPGNHDASMSELKPDSLSAVFEQDNLVSVYTSLGSYLDIDNYRLHFFPYPSKKEMAKYKLNSTVTIFDNINPAQIFSLSKDKKNILVCHTILEGAKISDNKLADINHLLVNYDVYIPKYIWEQFDYVFAGHLHFYQVIAEGVVYSGCPTPLTYTDAQETGWVLWDDSTGELLPEFVSVFKRYKFITEDFGDVSDNANPLEYIKDFLTKRDYTDNHIRVKYTIRRDKHSILNNKEILDCLKTAKSIQIIPEYVQSEKESTSTLSLDDFKHDTIKDIINEYIKKHKLSSRVKDIATGIELEILNKKDIDILGNVHLQLQKLDAENFKCFKDIHIDFEKLNPIIGVFGKNRIGKSSLVEGIVWGLFGQTFRNKEVQSVIRNGESSSTVVVEFISNKKQYKIIRTRNLKQGKLSLFHKNGEDWIDISGEDVKHTQRLINNLVGSYDVFSSTVYSPQNGVDLLLKKKPSERKQIIIDCLNINALTLRREVVSTRKRLLKDRIQQLNGKLSVYEQKKKAANEEQLLSDKNISESNINELTRRKNTAAEKLAELVGNIDRVDNLVEEMKALSRQIEMCNLDINGLKIKINEKTKELNDLLAYDGTAKNIEIKLNEIKIHQEELKIFLQKKEKFTLLSEQLRARQKDQKNQQLLYKERIRTIVDQMDMIRAQFDGVKLLDCSRSDCPLNNALKLNKDGLRNLYITLKNNLEEIKKNSNKDDEIIQKEISRLEMDIALLEYDPDAHMTLAKKLTQEQESERELIVIRSKLESLDKIKQDTQSFIDVYEKVVQDKSTEKETLNTKKQSINTILVDTYLKKRNLELSQIQVTALEAELKEETKKYDKVVNLLTSIKEASDSFREISKSLTYVKGCLSVYDQYEDIVGSTGIIFSLIKNIVIPFIEKFINKALSDSKNPFTISIESFKVTSNHDQVDDIMIYLVDEKGRRDILEASGAELAIVSLALRAALANLLSFRTGTHVELFIVDEGMGVFDDQYLSIVKSIFGQLGTIFQKILLITHIPELKSIAQSTLEVYSDGLISKIREL